MLIETLLGIPFFVIGRCSPMHAGSHWLPGKWTRINLSQAASGMILQNHRRLPVSIFIVKIAAESIPYFLSPLSVVMEQVTPQQCTLNVFYIRVLRGHC
jgi:hypothetical protein